MGEAASEIRRMASLYCTAESVLSLRCCMYYDATRVQSEAPLCASCPKPFVRAQLVQRAENQLHILITATERQARPLLEILFA